MADKILDSKAISCFYDSDIVDSELWSLEYLTDRLFLRLAGVKQPIYNEKGAITIRKYYRQALSIWWQIPIYRPPPEFVINTEDLNGRLVRELQALTVRSRSLVLRQAVGRIFENIDYSYYHLSIAKFLKVRLAQGSQNVK